jgi:DNA primase
MDVIASHMIGVKNVVAVSGTAFTEGQVALIKRFTSNLFLSFDGDAAGVEALKRALVLALPLEMKVKVVCLHEAKDAAELIEKNSDSWRSALGNSRGYLAFLLEFYRNKFTNLEDCNERILDEIFPFMALVKKKTLLDRMIAFLAQELFLKTDSVYEDFNSFQAKNRRSNFIGNQEKITQPIKEHLAAHELLLGMIIAYPELLADFERDLVNCFACFSLGDVYKQILNNYNSSRLEFDRDNFLAQLSDEQRTKINILTLQVEYIYKEFSFDSLKIEASKLFAFLQQNMKRLRRDRLERDLKEAEKAADSEKVNALLLEIQKTY